MSLGETANITTNSSLVEEGEEFVITCNAQGGPNNTYEWTLNGETLTERDGLEITTISYDTYSTSTLRIANVDAATDKGNYTCLVYNDAGEDNTSIVLVGTIPFFTSIFIWNQYLFLENYSISCWDCRSHSR